MSEASAVRHMWHVVAAEPDVGDVPVSRTLLGTSLVLWRSATSIHGAVDRCPHRGARLSRGWVDDGCVVCPYHAWHFGPSGRAQYVPQLDADVPIPPRATLTSVHVAERYGYIWVSLDTPHTDIPEVPEASGDGWRIIHEFCEQWAASAPRVIDNSLDIAHTAVVHRTSIGDYDKPKVASYTVERNQDGLKVRVPVETKGTEAQGAADNHAVRDVELELIGPFAFIARIGYDTGARHVIVTFATPIDDTHSLFVQFVARDDPPDAERDADIVALDRKVTLEDQYIVEGTDPDFPIDITAEVHLRCDRVTVEYRRYLATVLAATAVAGAPA